MARKTKAEVTAEARLESQLRARTKDKQETDKKYRALQDDLSQLERAYADALNIMGSKPQVYKLKPLKPRGHGSATCFALLSDVHCDEIVPKHKVNGLNEHNPSISKRRVDRFFALLLKFLRVERQESQIDQLVLWLGGDMFTSSESHGTPVAMDTMDAVEYAKALIASGITFLREQEPNLSIHIVCSCGNHSRKETGKPVNQAREQELSLEFIMYHALRAQFASDPLMTWQIDRSYMSYVKVYDKTIRFCHGHLGFRYNMGLGGLHGPLWKVISQTWNNQVDADLTCVGHWHSYTPAALARPYICNGSTIGVSPYSLNFGAEPPAQAFFLMHSRYGLVGQRPLFVDL